MVSFGWRILLITVGLAVALGVWLAMQPQPADVDVAEITRGPLVVTVRDDGRTRIRERYVVSSPLSGRLLRITLDPGDRVEAGETLLTTLEPTYASMLDPREAAQAQARVRAAEARLKRAAPLLKSAEETLQHAEAEMARLQKLVDRSAAAQQGLDTQVLAFRKAGHEYEAARFELEVAQYELEVARAALVRTGGERAEDTDGNVDESEAAPEQAFPIYSPISGSVLRVFQESSTVVQAGERIMEVGDPADLEIEADVLSTAAVRIAPGARVMIDQWGGDRMLAGEVRLVEPSAFTKVSALGIEEQRVNVIIDLHETAEGLPQLGDGYRVEVSIVEWGGDDVLRVPAGALFRSGDSWAVYVVRGSKAAETKIRIGHRNDEFAEVREGISEGDTVVLYPRDRVEHGTVVRPRPE